ncbi:MAG: hypothetical protein RJA07_2205 [Bacteroidota bacterium]|jgi:hypothetical protein
MSDLSTDQNNPTPNSSFDAVNNSNQKPETKKVSSEKSNAKIPIVPITIIFVSIIILTLAALKWHHEGRLFSKAEPKKVEAEKSPYDTVAAMVDTPMVAAIDTTIIDTAIVKETKTEAPIKEKPIEKIVEQKPKEEPKKATDLFGKEMKEMPSSFEGYLTTMANPAVDYDSRFSYADNNMANYFTSNAMAIQVDEKGNEINKMSVDEFLGVLRVNEFKIRIKDKQQSGGRIAVLKFSYQF